MNRFRIQSFKNPMNGISFHLQEIGVNNGKYICAEGALKGYHDFMCQSDYRINSVYRYGQNEGLFVIGDRIAIHPNVKSIITRFTIESNEIIVWFDNFELTNGNITTSNNRIRFINAVLYNIPTLPPIVNQPAQSLNIGTKPTPEWLNAIEAKIIANTPIIRLDNTLKKEFIGMSLETFLTNFIKDYNRNRSTIQVSNKSTQTVQGKRRSLGDIFMICRYYYPKCTLKEVVYLLYVKFPTSISGFMSNKCGQIYKRVWYYHSIGHSFSQENQFDEYNKYKYDYINLF